MKRIWHKVSRRIWILYWSRGFKGQPQTSALTALPLNHFQKFISTSWYPIVPIKMLHLLVYRRYVQESSDCWLKGRLHPAIVKLWYSVTNNTNSHILPCWYTLPQSTVYHEAPVDLSEQINLFSDLQGFLSVCYHVLISLEDPVHHKSPVTVAVLAPLLDQPGLESFSHHLTVTSCQQIHRLDTHQPHQIETTTSSITLSIHSLSVMAKKMSASVSQV